jgi:hypothetical protein
MNEKRRSMRCGTQLTRALIVLALAACAELPHGLDETRLSFEGFVTSSVDGAPIEGAQVNYMACFGDCWISKTTYTDAEGWYAISKRRFCNPSAKDSIMDYLEAVDPDWGVSTSRGFQQCTTATQTIDFVLTPWDPSPWLGG